MEPNPSNTFERPEGTVDRWSGNVIRKTDNGLRGTDTYGSMDTKPVKQKKLDLMGWLHGHRK